MSELIDRLRAGASDLCAPECCYGNTMTEAADEIERLLAARTPQPIDTAPRDGTIVDLWLTGGGRMTDQWWDDGDGRRQGQNQDQKRYSARVSRPAYLDG